MIYKPSNLLPNLQEIDTDKEQSFSCQVNTSGEPVKAYKMKILSGRGDKILYDSDFQTTTSSGSPINVYNKKILTTNKFIPSESNIINGKDYQWNIRLYNAQDDTGKPNTKVCDGFLAGSTKQVFWCRIPKESNIVKIKITTEGDYQNNTYIVSKEDLNSEENKTTLQTKYYSDWNLEGQVQITPFEYSIEIQETMQSNLQKTIDQIVYDRYIQIPNYDSNNQPYFIYNAKEEGADKPIVPASPERKKIEWVDKGIGRNENMVKIETTEPFTMTYGDGTPFEIYLCPADHTVNSVYADPNSEIVQSYYCIIYKTYQDALNAAHQGETPSVVKDDSKWSNSMKKVITYVKNESGTETTVTDTIYRARKITGYSQDTGEIRVTDSFYEPPVNGEYYRLFQYNSVTAEYKPIDDVTFTTSGEGAETTYIDTVNNLTGHKIGGMPIVIYDTADNDFSSKYFKIISNHWGENSDDRRLFIQPNINIKTDNEMCEELTFSEDSENIILISPIRIDIVQQLVDEEDPNSEDITFDKLDNSQWLLEGDSIGEDIYGTIQDHELSPEILNEYLINQRNYEVYTNFSDSMPNAVFYARSEPEIVLMAKNYVDSTDTLKNLEGNTLTYQDVLFAVKTEFSQGEAEQEQKFLEFIDRVKYYKYQLYSGDKIVDSALVAESDEIYNTELIWFFRGLERTSITHENYTVVLTITDEYDKIFINSATFAVEYAVEDSPDTLTVELECHEQAMQINSLSPVDAETMDVREEENGEIVTKIPTVTTYDIKTSDELVGKNYVNIPIGVKNSQSIAEEIEPKALNYTRTMAEKTPIEISNDFVFRTQFRLPNKFAKQLGGFAFNAIQDQTYEYIYSGFSVDANKYYYIKDENGNIDWTPDESKKTTESTQVLYDINAVYFYSYDEEQEINHYYQPEDVTYFLKEQDILEIARPIRDAEGEVITKDGEEQYEYYTLSMTPVKYFYPVLQSGVDYYINSDDAYNEVSKVGQTDKTYLLYYDFNNSDSNYNGYYILIENENGKGSTKYYINIKDACGKVQYYSNGQELRGETSLSGLDDSLINFRLYKTKVSGDIQNRQLISSFDLKEGNYNLKQKEHFSIQKTLKYILQSDKEYKKVKQLTDIPYTLTSEEEYSENIKYVLDVEVNGDWLDGNNNRYYRGIYKPVIDSTQGEFGTITGWEQDTTEEYIRAANISVLPKIQEQSNGSSPSPSGPVIDMDIETGFKTPTEYTNKVWEFNENYGYARRNEACYTDPECTEKIYGDYIDSKYVTSQGLLKVKMVVVKDTENNTGNYYFKKMVNGQYLPYYLEPNSVDKGGKWINDNEVIGESTSSFLIGFEKVGEEGQDLDLYIPLYSENMYPPFPQSTFIDSLYNGVCESMIDNEGYEWVKYNTDTNTKFAPYGILKTFSGDLTNYASIINEQNLPKWIDFVFNYPETGGIGYYNNLYFNAEPAGYIYKPTSETGEPIVIGYDNVAEGDMDKWYICVILPWTASLHDGWMQKFYIPYISPQISKIERSVVYIDETYNNVYNSFDNCWFQFELKATVDANNETNISTYINIERGVV